MNAAAMEINPNAKTRGQPQSASSLVVRHQLSVADAGAGAGAATLQPSDTIPGTPIRGYPRRFLSQ